MGAQEGARDGRHATILGGGYSGNSGGFHHMGISYAEVLDRGHSFQTSDERSGPGRKGILDFKHDDPWTLRKAYDTDDEVRRCLLRDYVLGATVFN